MRHGTGSEEFSLEAALRRLSAGRPELRVAPGEADVAFPSLGEVARGPVLEGWLAETATLAAGIDAKTAAAYLVSIFTWELGQVLGALYLDGTALPPLDPANLMARQQVSGEGSARQMHFHFRISATGSGRPFDRGALERTMIDLHAPLVAGLHQRTRLSVRGLWRLVTDGMSAGLLAHGKAAGCVDLAREEASAVLAGSGSPLRNAQWRFVEVAAEGAAPEWFRLRGGCCRLYRSEGGELCTTCVLRPLEDQLARLGAFVRHRER